MAGKVRQAAPFSDFPARSHGKMFAVIDTSSPYEYDLVVLGAGAAGLLAAARAAECGARVLLAEKNRRPGVKILISGGTRCNITNARGLRRLDVVSGPVDPAYDPAESRGIRAIQQAFGENGAFLVPALRRFDVDATVRLFEEAGVPTKVEANGKIFPVTDRAADVLGALVERLERSGAALRCLSPALAIDPWEGESGAGSGFAVRLPEATIIARRVLVAVGGSSYPGCGTTGDGYALARRFGHRMVDPRPALVPLRVRPDWIPGLRGLSVADSVASVYAGATLLQARREAVLFTHRGLSGPAILDVSRAVANRAAAEPLTLRLDLLPGLARDDLENRLQAESRQGRRSVLSLLPGELPRRLGECLMVTAAIPLDRMGPDLSRDERRRLLGVLKELCLPILGTLGFEKAEVTAGGIELGEVDPKTLESRLAPGLFFAGEILDLDGLIGGYNFQAAWSTGWLAGESAAKMTSSGGGRSGLIKE
jgi:predicted Rossmann fold flavoprotein